MEKYRELYRTPDYSLIPAIEAFDYQALPEKYLLAFYMRYPQYTGVAYKYEPDPVDQRKDLSIIRYHMTKMSFSGAETRFRMEESAIAYKALRTNFSTAVGAWVCMKYVQQEFHNTSEEELKRQRKEKDARDATWKKERKIREKIYTLDKADPYFLDYAHNYLEKEELKVLDKMLKEDEQYMLEHPEPSYQVQKLKMLRKALKKNQRDFAKMIDYPVGKYADFENGKISAYWFDWIGVIKTHESFVWFMKLVCATKVNPEWLLDRTENSLYGVDENARLGKPGNSWLTPMFATEAEIRKWEEENLRIAEESWKLRINGNL